MAVYPGRNLLLNIGDLAKYMSRTILIVDIDDEWVHGLELGENEVAKYKHHVVKKIQAEYFKVPGEFSDFSVEAV